MKTLIQLVLVALIAGGISAAATIFTRKPVAPTVAGADGQVPVAPATTPQPDATAPEPKTSIETPTADEPKSDVTAEKKPTAQEQDPLAAAEPPRGPQVPSKRPLSPDVTETTTSRSEGTPATPETRVAVRPPYSPEGDEGGALINLLRDRARAATETERRLAERQDAMQLIFEDLRAEQAQTLKIRQRLANELKESREAVDAEFQIVETERASIKKDVEDARRAADAAVRAANEERDKLRKQLEQANSPADTNAKSNNTGGSPEDNVNIKKMAAVFDGMPADSVAKVFEQLVKNKRIESVVALMNAMKERQAAKVLSTISDTNAELAADLADRLKRLKAASEMPATE